MVEVKASEIMQMNKQKMIEAEAAQALLNKMGKKKGSDEESSDENQ